MKIRTFTLAVFVAALVVVSSAWAVPDIELMGKLKALSEDKRLNLRQDDPVATCFVITIDIDGPGALAHLRVERDGDQSAVLVCSADGLPYLFVGSHAGFRINGGAPGHVIVPSDPEFGVIVGQSADGEGMRFDIDVRKKSKGNTIAFDLGGALALLMDKALAASFDKETGEATIKGPKSYASVVRAADDAAYPIERMSFNTVDGAKMTLVAKVLKQRPADSILAVSAKDIAALDLKQVSTSENIEGPSHSAYPSATTWRDERNRDAGETLAKLFKPSAARTSDAVKALKPPKQLIEEAKVDPRVTPEIKALIDEGNLAYVRAELVIEGMGTVPDLKQKQIDRKMNGMQAMLARSLTQLAEKGPSELSGGQIREAMDVEPVVLEMLNDVDGKTFHERWEQASRFELVTPMVKSSEVPMLWKALKQIDATPEQFKRFQAYLNRGEEEIAALQKDGLAGKVNVEERARRVKVIDEAHKKEIGEIFSAEQWEKFLTAMGSRFKGI